MKLRRYTWAVDDKVAQRAGAFSTPLTMVNVEKHLEVWCCTFKPLEPRLESAWCHHFKARI